MHTGEKMKGNRNISFAWALTLISIVCFHGFSIAGAFNAQGNGGKVLWMKILSEIDPRTNRYTLLALEEAEDIEADLVILELDTYGGAVNDADDIRTRILEFEKPIYVYINKDAASAGALISIACDSIYMAPGASIGAATVVVATGQAAPDKYQSYMRSIMRSTAEAKGRDPRIAEAMVDENIEIDSISQAGEVLTFSTSEAVKHGFCEAEVGDREALMKRLEIDDYEIVEYELKGSEKIIRFFINPIISGLLMLIIIGGIYFELQTPGVGFPLAAAIIAAVLYFIPYYLNGLAENWEIIAFFVGLALIALEIFVIPGFGLAGISGIVLTLGALILVMLNNDLFDFSFVDNKDIFLAIGTTITSMLAAIIVMFFGGVRLTNTRVFQRIALQATQDRSAGYTSNFKQESYLGKTGKTYTVLRPSGKIVINGEIFDAYSRGEFIDKNTDVIVIEESGTSLKVKAID
jgi:membrane-bound serine protease (ClpP class)